MPPGGQGAGARLRQPLAAPPAGCGGGRAPAHPGVRRLPRQALWRDSDAATALHALHQLGRARRARWWPATGQRGDQCPGRDADRGPGHPHLALSPRPGSSGRRRRTAGRSQPARQRWCSPLGSLLRTRCEWVSGGREGLTTSPAGGKGRLGFRAGRRSSTPSPPTAAGTTTPRRLPPPPGGGRASRPSPGACCPSTTGWTGCTCGAASPHPAHPQASANRVERRRRHLWGGRRCFDRIRWRCGVACRHVEGARPTLPGARRGACLGAGGPPSPRALRAAAASSPAAGGGYCPERAGDWAWADVGPGREAAAA